MLPKDGFGGTYHFLAKGDFAGLVLVALQGKPMHGYEIMKAIEERFHGFYKPSAGAIYPALRSLLRKGLVTIAGEERRKTYRITKKGEDYLGGVRAELKARFNQVQRNMGPERAAMFREFRNTGRLIATNMRTVTPKQARDLRALIVEMRKRILKILTE